MRVSTEERTGRTPNQLRLAAMIRRFYACWGDEFARTRRSPWPGWWRWHALLAEGQPRRVLDVGCGNGRLSEFLRRANQERSRRLGVGVPTTSWVVGIDASMPLLALEDCPRLAAELDPRSWPLATTARFDLVTLLAVLQHLPGEGFRAAVLERLASHVGPGGLLVVSLWRFDQSPRLLARRRPWSDLPPELEVEEAELEVGDALLGFGDDPQALRFVHAFDEAEVGRVGEVVQRAGLVAVADYVADGHQGDLNRYLVWQRR